MAKTPKVSILERRLQGQNVFGSGTQPIALKEPRKWAVRWVNSGLRPDRVWAVNNELGWTYVEPEDLDCSVDEIGAAVRDGRVVRGDRGQEVLVKMPTKDYAKVQARKAELNTKQTFGKKQIKDAMVSAVAGEHGDRAGDFMSRAVNTVNVNDQRGPEDTSGI